MYRLLILFCCITLSIQHGYLAWPPNRSSLWRYGYKTPTNYNDNSLYCGGRMALEEAQGKCGVCGDPYYGRKEHEAGGKFASGIITERYPVNTKTIKVSVKLTVNHRGYFEFRLCPHNNIHVPVRKECFNTFLLPIFEGDRYQRKKYYPKEADGPMYNLTLKIPRGVICSQCVLQWRYHTGNSWGLDNNGTGCVGCGLQEEFYNCADISIGIASLIKDKNITEHAVLISRDAKTTQTANSSKTHTTVTRQKSKKSKVVKQDQRKLKNAIYSNNELSATKAQLLSSTKGFTNHKLNRTVSAHSLPLTKNVNISNKEISAGDISSYDKFVDNNNKPYKSSLTFRGQTSKHVRPILKSNRLTKSKSFSRRNNKTYSMTESVRKKDKWMSSNFLNLEKDNPDMLTKMVYQPEQIFSSINGSRTFVISNAKKAKNRVPARKKYVIVRKVENSINTLGKMDKIISQNYIVRRRRIRLPKKLIKSMKPQDLLNYIQIQLPDVKEIQNVF